VETRKTGICRGGSRWILRQRHKADAAVLRQNFFFSREISVLFFRTFNGLDEAHPNYQG
jgi:hypothetical protein